MSKFSLLLLVVAIALGAVVFQDRHKISELERRLEAEKNERAGLLKSTEQAQEEAKRLAADVGTFKSESEHLRKQLATRPPAPASGADARASDEAAAKSKEGGPGNPMAGFAKMFTDPEMKKSMRVQQSMGIRMLYGDLARQLGLSAEEADHLMDVLTDRQMDLAAAAMANGAAGLGSEESLTKGRDAQARATEQLKAILGEEKFAEFRKYERSIGDRFMLQQFEGQFAAMGAPLQASQKDGLLNVMAEERVKTPNQLVNNANPKEQLEALRSEKALEDFLSSQEAFNRRVLERSRSILTPDQIVALEKAQKQGLEMMKAQVKISRDFLGVGN